MSDEEPGAVLYGDLAQETIIEAPRMAFYEGMLTLSWELYYSSTIERAAKNIAFCFEMLGDEAREVKDVQRDQFDSMLCRFYRLSALIERERMEIDKAFDHINHAVSLAERLIMWKGIGTMLPMTDTGYLWLPGAFNQDWTAEEQAILREMYPCEHADAILECLPNRAWQSVIAHAYRLKVKRNVFKSPSDKAAHYLSVNDSKFMEQYHIAMREKEKGYVFWSKKGSVIAVRAGATASNP